MLFRTFSAPGVLGSRLGRCPRLLHFAPLALGTNYLIGGSFRVSVARGSDKLKFVGLCSQY